MTTERPRTYQDAQEDRTRAWNTGKYQQSLEFAEEAFDLGLDDLQRTEAARNGAAAIIRGAESNQCTTFTSVNTALEIADKTSRRALLEEPILEGAHRHRAATLHFMAQYTLGQAMDPEVDTPRFPGMTTTGLSSGEQAVAWLREARRQFKKDRIQQKLGRVASIRPDQMEVNMMPTKVLAEALYGSRLRALGNAIWAARAAIGGSENPRFVREFNPRLSKEEIAEKKKKYQGKTFAAIGLAAANLIRRKPGARTFKLAQEARII